MTVLDLSTILDNWAAPLLAESYDNVGLIVGQYGWMIEKVLVSLDATEAIIAEAKAIGANVIVSHHPIWFSKRNHLRGQDYVSRVITQAIKHDIALIAIHTNLDAISTGVNFEMARRLKLSNLRFISPKTANNGQDSGIGMIGELPHPLAIDAFLVALQTTFHCKAIKYTPVTFEEVSIVAICGGSGSFLLHHVKAKGAHAFVTADVKYHDFFDAEGQILYCDIGHYESEQFTIPLIINYLTEQLAKQNVSVPIIPAQTNTNPIQYWV